MDRNIYLDSDEELGNTLKKLQDCQEIIYEYRCEMKDGDYLTLCTNLQSFYFHVKDLRRMSRAYSSLLSDIIVTRNQSPRLLSSHDCMLFLLNIIKGIIWFYSIFMIGIVLYTIFNLKIH
jgi:hypothetical protein